MIKITDVTILKNPVTTSEEFKISISLRELIDEPIRHRLAFRLGSPKGSLGGASGFGKTITAEPKDYMLSFTLGSPLGTLGGGGVGRVTKEPKMHRLQFVLGANQGGVF